MSTPQVGTPQVDMLWLSTAPVDKLQRSLLQVSTPLRVSTLQLNTLQVSWLQVRTPLVNHLQVNSL